MVPIVTVSMSLAMYFEKMVSMRSAAVCCGQEAGN
jgi:hypothetical protein